MTLAVLALTLALQAGPSPSSAPDPLAEARGFYEAGDYARARDLFRQDVEGADLTPEQLRNARVYLAASYYYLKDVDAARRQLEVLFHANPYARIDPVLFPPEIVQLGDQVLAKLASDASPAPAASPPPAAPPAPQRAAAPEANPFPASADSSVGRGEPAASTASAHPPPAGKPPLGYSFIPFGVGQFANDQSTKGVAVAVLEGLAVGGFATTAALAESLKTAGTPFISYQVAPQNQSAFQAYETTYLVCFWVGVGVYAVGVADSLISRSSLDKGQGSGDTALSFPVGRTGLQVSADASGLHW